MNRRLCFIMCIAVCLLVLVGCNEPDTTDPNNTPPESADSNSPPESIDPADLETTPYETVNNFVGVTMTVDQETVSNTGLTVVFENNTERECIYGEYFSLEKKINGTWYQLPVVVDGNYGFNDIGYPLPPGGSGEFTAKWEWLYGTLEPGNYRIVKDILDVREPGDFDTYYLAAEFEI
ncbi:immunoglobulin-like domain-containing protein [Dethiobacter alkaliphilus]|uniref:Bacterial Ig-like domain-containing protein n=1 Tax=Dethiobacter alkaliphilus AHT 1 TaxID=555088 RepID=C0GDA6_DETAL|nr:immunoglobulin-like domain-containing protein [Dethiobacter alkaliphilus]EEG78627.1 conserved hypothetical protein [Dethiobacter alkaliphilus AHT 1]